MDQSPRILIVDDEPLIVKMLSKYLEAEGFRVSNAVNGYEGLTMARAELPDLVILDLVLPRLNGYEVCTMLKHDTRYQQIPIVMLTAKTQDKDEQLGRACGAEAYLRKPIRAQDLLVQIRALLGANGQPAGPQERGLSPDDECAPQ